MKHIRFPNFCGALAEGVRPDLLKINDCQERVNMETNTVGEVEKRKGIDSFAAISHGGTGQLSNTEYAGIRDFWVWYPRRSLSFNGKDYLFLIWIDPDDDNLGALFLLYYDTSTHSWLKYDTSESDMNLFDDMYRPTGCQNTYGMIFADGRDNNALRFVEVGDNDIISWGTVGQAIPKTALSQDRTTTGNVYSSGTDATGMNVVKGSILQYCYTVESDTGEEGNPSPVSSDDYMQTMRLTDDTSEAEWVQVSTILTGFSTGTAVNNKEKKYYRIYRRDVLYTEDIIGAYPFRFVARIPIGATTGRDASAYTSQELSYDNQTAPKGDDLGESGEVLFVANSNGSIQFPFSFDYFSKLEINNQNTQAFVNGPYKIRIFDEEIFGTTAGHRTMYEMLEGISSWKNLIRLFDIDQTTPLPVVFDTQVNITISYIKNGDFWSSTGWTFGTSGGHGWFYGITGAYCDGENAATVTLTGSAPGGTPMIEGEEYLVSFTLANYSGSISGYLTPALGGTTGKLISCTAGTHSMVITAGSGNNFTLLAGINTRCQINSVTIYPWSAFFYTRLLLVPASAIHELYFCWCETALGVTDATWQTPAYGEFVDFGTWTGQKVFQSLSRVRGSGQYVCISGEGGHTTVSGNVNAVNRGDQNSPLILHNTAAISSTEVAQVLGNSLGITHDTYEMVADTDYAEVAKGGNFDSITAFGWIRLDLANIPTEGGYANPFGSIYSSISGLNGWAVGLNHDYTYGRYHALIASPGNTWIVVDGGAGIVLPSGEATYFILFSISGMSSESITDRTAYLYLADDNGSVYVNQEVTYPATSGVLEGKFRIGYAGDSGSPSNPYLAIPGIIYDQVNVIGNVYVNTALNAGNMMNFMPRFASEHIGWDGTENRSITVTPAQAIYDDSPIGTLRWSSVGGRAFPPLNYANFPEEIVKIIPVRLLYQSTYAMSILVFTRSGYYRMILDGSADEWRSKISQILIDEQSQYGTPYADSFIIVGDYVYFVNEHGVYRTYVNSGEPINISRGYLDLPAVSSFDYRLAIYVPQRDQILFHFENVATPANNKTLVLDLQASDKDRPSWNRFTGMSIRGGDILRETDYNIFIDSNGGNSLLKQYPGSEYTTESAYVRTAKVQVDNGRLVGYCFDYTGTGAITARAYSTKLSGGYADTSITPSGAEEAAAVPPGVIGKFFDFVLEGDTVKSFDAIISDRLGG